MKRAVRNLIASAVAVAVGLGTLGALQAAPAGKLEIFSWWTAGGEAEALNAVFAIYHARYPAVQIVNATVAGGAGTNAKAVLKTRMLGGDPESKVSAETYDVPVHRLGGREVWHELTRNAGDEGHDDIGRSRAPLYLD